MEKTFQKAIRKQIGNKSEEELLKCLMGTNQTETTHEPSNRPLTAKVTKITHRGFLLRVSGTDYYFLSFNNFPWFRYASDKDIKLIRVFYGDPEYSGEFTIEWPMLDLSFGTNEIAWHSKHPFKSACPIVYPSIVGTLSARTRDFTGCPVHEVDATFTVKGKFSVIAENEEQARWFVENQCKIRCSGIVVDVDVPFNGISWNLPHHIKADALKQE